MTYLPHTEEEYRKTLGYYKLDKHFAQGPA